MPNDCKHPFKHAGAGRTDRLLKALMPSNVALDNREMADLMVFAARFGKVIKYWDTNNAPDGDWSCFWESDYLFFLATVAASNTEGSEKAFRELEKKLLDDQETAPSVASKRTDMAALIHLIRELALDMASWGQKADAFPALQQDITTIVRNTLQQPLRDLIAYAKGLPYPNDFDAFIFKPNRHPFIKEWNITQFDVEQNIDFIDPTIDYFASWQALRKIFRRFVLAHERVRKQAEKYLQTTQNDPTQRQHPPHIVLFISFLHLFKHLQDQLNALPEKHLDYYYNDILHLQNRGEIPDHAHLVFQLALNVYQQTLPVGTLFRAGKSPDGKDMFYTLERPLTLNQAQVVEVKTLLVQPNIKDTTVTAASIAWENTVLDTDKTNDVPDKMKDVTPFRPLGNKETDKKVEVGFAISSAILPKSKSKRTIRFDFATPNIVDITPLLNNNLKSEVTTKETWIVKQEPVLPYLFSVSQLTTTSPFVLTVLDAVTKFPIKDFDRLAKIVNPLDNSNLILTRTNIDGQYIFKNNLVKDNALDFVLKGYNPFNTVFTGVGDLTRLNFPFLSRDIEDVTPTDAGVGTIDVASSTASATQKNPFNVIVALKNEPAFSDPSAYKKDKNLALLTEPVIKFSLTDKSSMYAEVYDALSTNALTSIGARVLVEDLTDFDIYEGSINRPLGHTQNIDLTSAWRAGGLLVRCDEAFKKGLDNLTFSLTNKGADAGITAASLYINGKNAYSVSNPPSDSVTVSSFQTLLSTDEKEQAQLDAYLKIDLIYKRPTITIKPAVPEIPAVGNTAAVPAVPAVTKIQEFDSPVFADAVIKYEIIRPLDKAEFFHLSSHGGYEAMSPVGSPLMPPFPNPEPAFPTVVATKEAVLKGAVVTEGSPTVSAADEQPRGALDSTDKPTLSNSLTPAPPILYRGNLFIGIKEPPKLGIVSLLFQVADGTEVDLESFPPDIDWSYLSGNQWQRFPSRNIVFDSTKADEGSKRSLVQSGVIEFQMPADAKKGDTLLNPAYYWIRASATETATPIQTTVGALPSIVGIFAQAGSVRLATLPMDARHFDQALPPQTINQLKFRQAAVKLIEQPYEGFGGRAVEQGGTYHLRISERLRHKKRAITAWDYEHLVLEQFPEVRFVKCINHSHPVSKAEFNTLKTGAVAVVVMPLKTTKPLQPQTNRRTLENIKSYLKTYSNGFTSGDDLLQVIPPQYQAVVVSLRVKFQAGDTEKLVHNLDNDIARLIAPWAFDAAIEPTFGQNLYRTTLLSQIEALDYVDYIEDFYIVEAISDDTDTNKNKNTITISAQFDTVTKKALVRKITLTGVATPSFIAPNDARTLLTAHQLTAQTPFETNHSITPL